MTIPGVNTLLLLSILLPLILITVTIHLFVARSTHPLKIIYSLTMTLIFGWSIILLLMYTTSSVQSIPLLRNLSTFFDVLTYPTTLLFYIVLSRSISMSKHNEKLIAAVLYSIAVVYLIAIYTLFPINVDDVTFLKSNKLLSINANIAMAEKYYFFFIAPYTAALLYNTYATLSHIANKRNLLPYIVVFVGIILSGVNTSFVEFMTPANSLHVAPYVNPLAATSIILSLSYAIYRFEHYRIDSPKVVHCILNTIETAIILTDQFKSIVFANDSAKQLFDFHDDRERHNFEDILNDSNYSTDQYVITADKKSHRLKVSYIVEDSVKYYRYNESRLNDNNGQLYGYFYAIIDNTEMVESKNKLKRSYENLENEIKLRTYDLIHKSDILNTYNNQLRKELGRRMDMENKIKELAFKDSLTGLDNRRQFISTLEDIFLKTNLAQAHALVFLDINDFKTLNDNLGRNFGDEILMHTADVLRNYFGEEMLLSRLGSDEFAIFFKDYGSLQNISNKLTSLFNALSIPQLYDNLTLTTSYSAGIALFPMHSDSAERLINLAEIACREAKKMGENKFMCFKNEFQIELEQRFKTINKLKQAIAKDEFVLHYQPQVTMTEQGYRVTGLEALIRWQDGDTLVYPSSFISVAEQSKQIIEIGRFVINQAIKDISRLNKTYNLSLSMAINISAIQLADEFLYKTLSDALIENDFDPKLIELELTETVLVSQATAATSLINRFVNLGVKISVDDFGIEYSSLNYLKTLPINRIKLDMAFIRGIGKSERDETILEIILQLGKRLNLNVLAEGIETPEQLHFLTSRDCLNLQGYYFHKPMPYDSLIENSIVGPYGVEHKL